MLARPHLMVVAGCKLTLSIHPSSASQLDVVNVFCAGLFERHLLRHLSIAVVLRILLLAVSFKFVGSYFPELLLIP